MRNDPTCAECLRRAAHGYPLNPCFECFRLYRAAKATPTKSHFQRGSTNGKCR
jgi:hypothetical protein